MQNRPTVILLGSELNGEYTLQEREGVVDSASKLACTLMALQLLSTLWLALNRGSLRVKIE